MLFVALQPSLHAAKIVRRGADATGLKSATHFTEEGGLFDRV